ncbi:MAG: selenide, water dikinase SelD [Phycisphaerae bacterium]|nr:selenide, water dikinase SelD [Phycisphaerae bacterium]
MNKIDTQRRKRVMSRSIKLGHCVCNPAQPCPCEQFKKMDICACAGERPASPNGKVELTKTVEKPGCASKIGQKFLKDTLGDLPHYADKNVLVGVAAGDDAGIYDMGNGTALVQTVDVFTPSVDDPYTFGQIAAANSVSDVYAMGGKPLTALSIIGFPVGTIPDNALREILRGGIDKMKEAGVSIIGGHSINDPQTKAGFAVTGIIDTKKIKTNSTAQKGDVLILTKPLGTGIIAFAHQINRASQKSIDASAKSMTTLNKTACELMLKFNANACTDVTGFSLMGHLKEMATTSKLNVEIIWDKLPWLPGVLDYAAAGMLPGAIERNKESSAHKVTTGKDVTETMADMCFDAQTSGGLLIAIDKAKANEFLARLHAKGIADAAIIGHFKTEGSGQIFIKTDNTRKLPEKGNNKKNESCCSSKESSCCGGDSGNGFI